MSAVVPYATAGNSATQVQVEYMGQPSAAASFTIAPTSPGIFKLGDAGGGVGIWVVNQDNTLNSPGESCDGRRHRRLLCHRSRANQSAGVDGSVATSPYPVPTQKVSVTIAGVPAKLLYQGAAPYEIAGLLQINAVIPSGLTPSNNAPVVLTIGDASSQTATVAIH